MTDEELRVLAWTLLGEAAGENSRGMEAVAHVIRNRALSGRYPSNPASVALQSSTSGIHQFSTWNALGQGGNIPRARYPVGSSEFNKALAIAAKVFSATPGKDPTQGATHYYSPKGMPGEAEPYWWRSEAPQGGKKIGNHVFALKREEAVAPTPATRSVTANPGTFPSSGQMEVFRTGAPLQLPTVGPTGGPGLKSGKTAPVPAKQSLQMQMTREDAGATQRETRTVTLYDPITRSEVKRLPSASDLVRASGDTAKRTQVAGFSVPGGIDGIRQVDAIRAATPKAPSTPTASDRTRAAKTLPKTTAATQFAPNIAQPQGTLVRKDMSRLAPSGPLDFVPPTGRPLSRDAIAAAAAGAATAVKLTAPKIPPMPLPRPLARPVAVPVPQTTPLKIVVSGANPMAETIKQPISVVQSIRNEGYSPSEAYNLANLRAAERARESSSNTSGHSTSGGVRYDPGSGDWV